MNWSHRSQCSCIHAERTVSPKFPLKHVSFNVLKSCLHTYHVNNFFFHVNKLSLTHVLTSIYIHTRTRTKEKNMRRSIFCREPN